MGNKMAWTQPHAHFQVSETTPGWSFAIMLNLVEIGAVVWKSVARHPSL
jgi:hypothetical protein